MDVIADIQKKKKEHDRKKSSFTEQKIFLYFSSISIISSFFFLWEPELCPYFQGTDMERNTIDKLINDFTWNAVLFIIILVPLYRAFHPRGIIILHTQRVSRWKQTNVDFRS